MPKCSRLRSFRRNQLTSANGDNILTSVGSCTRYVWRQRAEWQAGKSASFTIVDAKVGEAQIPLLALIRWYTHASPQNCLFWGPGFGTSFCSILRPLLCFGLQMQFVTFWCCSWGHRGEQDRTEVGSKAPPAVAKGGWIRATTFEGTLQGGAWRVPPRGKKGLKPPWSPLKPFSSPLEALLKPPWSPLEALLKPPSSPLEAPFTLKPPSSPSQAPLKPPWSPSQAPLKPPSSEPPSSPPEALLKPPWSPSQAPLKPPWTGLKPRKPPSSPSEAPIQPPGSPSKPFPKGSFM